MKRAACLAMSLLLGFVCTGNGQLLAQSTRVDAAEATETAGTGAVPDFLQDYDKAVSPAATAVAPAVPAPAVPTATPAPAAPPASPSPGFSSGSTKAPASPSVSGAVRTPSKVAAPPSSTSTLSSRPIVLQGRLEEISGAGARLPAGVMLKLKAQQGRLDPGASKPRPDAQQGLVASFPVDFQGAWSGPITVWSSELDKAFWDWDSAAATETAQILRRGNSGQTSFNFYQTPQRTIYLEPAKVVFPPRINTQTADQLQKELKNSPMAAMLGAGGLSNQMVQAMSAKIPVFYLGDLQGRGVSGNQLSSVVIKNEIKQLKPGTLEQNIISRESERNAQNGQMRNSYGESVLRFTKLNANQLYVQLASLKYRNDGHFLQKVIMYGTINRGSGGDPASMMTMPGFGSFPGLQSSPSTGGATLPGFGDLNKLLKELSGN